MAFPGDFSQKRRIVIPATGAGADVTLPIRITEACLQNVLEIFDADGPSPCQNGGGDIRFSSDGATQIACDLRQCVTDNDPANGRLEAWVQHTALTASASELWIHWGTTGTSSQPAADDTYGSEAVYPASALGLWHLDQDPSGSAPQMLDSTANDHDGTSQGSMASGDLVDAAVGRGWRFDGSDDGSRVAAAGTTVGGISGNAAFTFEAVCRFASLGDFASLIFLGDPSAALQAAALVVRNTGAFGLSCAGSNNAHTAGSAVSTGVDYHLVVSKAAGALNTTTTLYRNGSSVALSGASAGTPNIDAAGGLGTFIGTGFLPAAATISLASIWNTNHSAAWAAVRHATLLSPGTFASAVPHVTPDSTTHGHTADSPTVTQTHAVAPADASHGHTADSPTVTQDHQVAPDDASHGHTADSPAVTQDHQITPADASHGHTADSPTVTQDHQITPADASHGHTADSPTVTQDHQIAPADASHGHTADSPAVTQDHQIAPASATHGHTADSPTVLIAPIRPANCRHGHRATIPLITQSHSVAPADCRHGHTADSPTVSDGSVILPAPVAGFTLPRQQDEFRLPWQEREFTLPRQQGEFRLEKAT